MKVKDTYILKKVANKHIVVPTKEATLNLNGIITLNETGKFLFECLESETTIEELTQKMISNYKIDYEIAKKDILAFVEVLRSKNMLDEA